MVADQIMLFAWICTGQCAWNKLCFGFYSNLAVCRHTVDDLIWWCSCMVCAMVINVETGLLAQRGGYHRGIS